MSFSHTLLNGLNQIPCGRIVLIITITVLSLRETAEFIGIVLLILFLLWSSFLYIPVVILTYRVWWLSLLSVPFSKTSLVITE